MTLQQYIDNVHRRFMLVNATGHTLREKQAIIQTDQKTPSLDPEKIKQIAEDLGMVFVPEKEAEGNVCMANSEEVRPEYRLTFAPVDLLDYSYAVLHSPDYREKYRELLEIDFSTLPYPKDAAVFWKLVQLGGQIRQIHLLESPVVEHYITQYPVDGDNEVTQPNYVPMTIAGKNDEAIRSLETGSVYINDTQYFDQVPELVWNFYIGGYQPAQKWLKDRMGRKLGFEDILHYQKIIVVLSETDRLMKEIDKVHSR